ncbi:phosphate acyltransferase PlsX [Mollicutes bacterium LVI A0039]|nr:phosphate acyltransferase PlsX [Mollicutes bacterium LVI A0039]
MSNNIGFDLHGADQGMEAVIEGLSLYLNESKSTSKITLFGNEQEAKTVLKKFNLDTNDNITVVHTTEVIENTEEPALAIRKKKDSSMVVGANALKNGEVDCFVSSGSTGALVASGIFIVGRIKGIERPALAGLLPSANKEKPTLILDLGANVESKPEHLIQYGTMGSQFMSSVYDIAEPKVALINVGSEDGKGSTLYKEAFYGLKEQDINFVGNVEAREVLTTKNDVLVIDGFSGNILLKSIEGTVALFNSEIKKAFFKNAKTKIAGLLVKNSLKDMKGQFDYRELGATPVFGVNGILLKAHGSSDSLAFKNAFRSADELITSDFLKNIK